MLDAEFTRQDILAYTYLTFSASLAFILYSSLLYLHVEVCLMLFCNQNSSPTDTFHYFAFYYSGIKRIPFFQCCGSGSVGSVCFWASRIRIH